MREKYETLKLSDLRDIAKKRGIKGVAALKKADIIEMMCQMDDQDRRENEAAETKVEEAKVEETKRQEPEANDKKPVEKKHKTRLQMIMPMQQLESPNARISWL
ncbi:MAG: Rho termination factor N-terminal domain-containing protein [Butyrivibrio sp.]|nr:Rho termination factor N-terminal domain-containing protein [Butyrivibrio sp.]